MSDRDRKLPAEGKDVPPLGDLNGLLHKNKRVMPKGGRFKPLLSMPVYKEATTSKSDNVSILNSSFLNNIADKVLQWIDRLMKTQPREGSVTEAGNLHKPVTHGSKHQAGKTSSKVKKLVTVAGSRFTNLNAVRLHKGLQQKYTLRKNQNVASHQLRKDDEVQIEQSKPVRKDVKKSRVKDLSQDVQKRVSRGSKPVKDVPKEVETHSRPLIREGKLKPFEDALALVGFLEYDMRNRQVGAYLLKNNQQYRFVFAFECTGLHPTLSDAELRGIMNRLENGMKDMPFGESLTFHYSSFRTGDDRLDYLKFLLSKTKSKIIQLIIIYEIKRIKELVERGVRKPKSLFLYATYTVNSEAEKSNSWYEKFLAYVFQSYEVITGDKQIREQKFESFIKQGFLDGYLKWENFLVSTLGLSVRPIRCTELWELAWRRFNKGKCKTTLPQYIYVGDTKVKEVIYSQVHPSTLLIAESEPVADERWVKVKGEYIGVLTMLEKPGGWENCRAQLRYLWSIIARERIYDVEVFSEITRANDNLVRESMRRLMKQSLTSQNIAAQESSIDVVAQMKAEEAVEAQAEMFSGAVPFWLGFTILVHRKNLEQLDEACRYLESCFLRPTWVQRERFLSWRIWLQTLPLTWEGILTKPYMRRLLMLHHEVLGLIPWIMPVTVDRVGLELITEEGGVPIWIDLTPSSEPKHLGIFATTRAGKSLLVAGIFTPALTIGMPVHIFDFPKPDGTSTFTDYTNNLGGAYFDISKESNNLFQIPDLSYHKPEDIPIFFSDFVAFLEAALMTMVLGKGEGISPVLKNNVRAILTLALNEFFQDHEILERYDLALYHGQGSSYWQAIPTLHDFLAFCKAERLNIKLGTPGLDEALEVINLRLRQWLVSRVGRSIATPTTFKSDSKLIVFALRNIQNEEDAAVLALAGLGSAMRCALSSPASIFFIDEAPILFEFPAISDLIGRLCANGAKAGIRVIISAQDPKTVVESSSGSKICDNLAIRLVGRIQPTAVPSFQKYLNYPLEIISRNATKAFFPNKNEIYSQWLLDYQGSYTYCRYYPGLLQLALVANNPDEQKLRDQIFAKHPDRLKAMVELAHALEVRLRG